MYNRRWMRWYFWFCWNVVYVLFEWWRQYMICTAIDWNEGGTTNRSNKRFMWYKKNCSIHKMSSMRKIEREEKQRQTSSAIFDCMSHTQRHTLLYILHSDWNASTLLAPHLKLNKFFVSKQSMRMQCFFSSRVCTTELLKTSDSYDRPTHFQWNRKCK